MDCKVPAIQQHRLEATNQAARFSKINTELQRQAGAALEEVTAITTVKAAVLDQMNVIFDGVNTRVTTMQSEAMDGFTEAYLYDLHVVTSTCSMNKYESRHEDLFVRSARNC